MACVDAKKPARIPAPATSVILPNQPGSGGLAEFELRKKTLKRHFRLDRRSPFPGFVRDGRPHARRAPGCRRRVRCVADRDRECVDDGHDDFVRQRLSLGLAVLVNFLVSVALFKRSSYAKVRLDPFQTHRHTKEGRGRFSPSQGEGSGMRQPCGATPSYRYATKRNPLALVVIGVGCACCQSCAPGPGAGLAAPQICRYRVPACSARPAVNPPLAHSPHSHFVIDNNTNPPQPDALAHADEKVRR